MLGFKATSEKLAQVITDALSAKIEDGSLVARDGRLYLP